MSVNDNLRLSNILIKWYKSNKRDLPWRKTTDPYVIWISEIILQQTRVDQGLSYFNRFISRFPNVRELAAAEENEVLKLWQGLGYYSRARNLHAAAKVIVEEFDGKFPVEYKDVLSLKGIGEYTAAAIVSFSYKQPYAVVDGNVYRVLSRIFAIDIPINSGKGKKYFSELAQSLLNDNQPGLHNQAIMEFGALQCVPISPDCQNCPASSICMANTKNKVASYPVKEKKQKTKVRYFNYFDIRENGYAFLHKRLKKDIWKGLYELPLIESEEELSVDDLIKNGSFNVLLNNDTEAEIKFIKKDKHILSHQIIHARFYRVEVKKIIMHEDYIKIQEQEIDKYPVSRLVHKYLEDLQ